MIQKEIEAILAWQDVGDGDVDVDGVIKAFERLISIATEADLPALLAAIRSPKNNFWTRELFAEPICHLGGADYLEPLLEAAQLGLDEGHDNDGFDCYLTELAGTEPEKCRAKLKSYWHEMVLNTVKQRTGYSSFALDRQYPHARKSIFQRVTLRRFPILSRSRYI